MRNLVGRRVGIRGSKKQLPKRLRKILSPSDVVVDSLNIRWLPLQREILQEVLRLKDELGFSVLFITHDIALMAQISDRIGIMRAGEIVEISNAAQIVTNPSHDYTRSLWEAMPILAKRPEGARHAV